MSSEQPLEQTVARVTPGVFFGAPVMLPRGPQALPRGDVLAAQRERLMAAITELIAAGGYTRVTVGTLAARAKVSRTAFYDCFANKEACAFAAYDRFIEVFLAAMAERASRAGDMHDLIGAMLDGYFSTLERDLAVARAFLVEFDALGPQARERRRVALRGIASYVRQMHEQWAGSDARLAPTFADEVYLGIVYIVRQLACDALDEQREPDLVGIGDILAPWLLNAFQPGAPSIPAQRLVASGRRAR